MDGHRRAHRARHRARARGGSGDPSPWTALGVEVAIRVDLRARLRHRRPERPQRSPWSGSATSAARLARLLAEGGAELVVADIDQAKRALAEELGADAGPTRRSAMTRRRRRPRAVRAGRRARPRDRPGAALPRDRRRRQQPARRRRVDAALAERGILWAPDFVANAGGIINIAVELEPEGYDAGRAPSATSARSATRCGTIFDSAAPRSRHRPRCAAALRARRERLAGLD